MGRGLVEPVDDIRLTNPASNEPLLAALAEDFADHHFDMRRLMRTILQSEAYERSSRPNSTNGADDRFYSRCIPRRLSGEALLDAICQVTEQAEKFAGMPAGTRAQGLPDTRVASEFLDSFGRPPRQVTCECERNSEPSVAQALHLMNAATLNRKIAAKGGLVDRLLDAGLSDAAVLNEMTMATLCRPPSAAELNLIASAMEEAGKSAPRQSGDSRAPVRSVGSAGSVGSDRSNKPTTSGQTVGAQPAQTKRSNTANTVAGAAPVDRRSLRKQVFADMLWALISGPEFQFNH
jgi:hypothetical protein